MRKKFSWKVVMTSVETPHIAGAQPDFPTAKNMGERLWGEETLLCHVQQKFIMKKLFVKKGCKGGLQYHRFKDEAGFLLSGRMIIRYDNGKGGLCEKIVIPGDVFHFSPGVVHQEEALEDCVIIEASTPIFNDRVRMEKDYELGEPHGMPTTAASEVEFG